jgi:hypothetical protein
MTTPKILKNLYREYKYFIQNNALSMENKMGLLDFLIKKAAIDPQDESLLNCAQAAELTEDSIKYGSHEIFKTLYEDVRTVKKSSHHEHYNNIKLFEHPLQAKCPNLQNGHSTKDLLLSSTYSSIITKELFSSHLTKLFHQSQVLTDVLYANAISASNRQTLTIKLIDDCQKYDASHTDLRGYFSRYTNSVVIAENKFDQINLSTLAHELAHKAMLVTFKHNSNPYNSSLIHKPIFIKAVKDTLNNIKDYLNNNYQLTIAFNDEDSTYQMGKKLGSLFNTKVSSKETVEFLFKSAIDIHSNNYPWMSNTRYIEYFLGQKSFQALEVLIQRGEKINYYDLQYEILVKNNLDFLKHFITIKPELSQKEFFFFNKIADRAQLLGLNEIYSIIEHYLENNNNWSNWFTNILFEYHKGYNGEIKYSTNSPANNIIDNNINVIKKLINIYIESYSKEKEHLEFVVALPQIMAEGEYKGAIIDIIQPLHDYWQQYITPAVQEYQQTADKSEFCLDMPKYHSLNDYVE